MIIMYVAHFLAAVWYSFVAWLCWLATAMFWEEQNTIAWMLVGAWRSFKAIFR